MWFFFSAEIYRVSKGGIIQMNYKTMPFESNGWIWTRTSSDFRSSWMLCCYINRSDLK